MCRVEPSKHNLKPGSVVSCSVWPPPEHRIVGSNPARVKWLEVIYRIAVACDLICPCYCEFDDKNESKNIF
jgi:hypothetical protein